MPALANRLLAQAGHLPRFRFQRYRKHVILAIFDLSIAVAV